MADSPRITAASFVPDSAICQPARLARGLRRVALERGVRIFERTAVRGIDRGRPAVVRAEHGAVRADQVVLTIGSWAASWPSFRRSFGVIADYMVVTEPIPELRRETGWTSNVGIADGRDLLYYLRPTDDNRIAIGGGRTGVAFAGRAESRAVTHDRRISDAAARGLGWLFPQLEGVRFAHAWGGPATCTQGSGSPATGCRRPSSAAGSSPARCWACGTSTPRCRSTPGRWRRRRRSRCGGRPFARPRGRCRAGTDGRTPGGAAGRCAPRSGRRRAGTGSGCCAAGPDAALRACRRGAAGAGGRAEPSVTRGAAARGSRRPRTAGPGASRRRTRWPRARAS